MGKEQAVCVLIRFQHPIYCQRSALGKKYPVTFNNCAGSLHFPKPAKPRSPEQVAANERWPTDLESPEPRKKWQLGGKPVFWGNEVSQPSGEARVHAATMELLPSNSQMPPDYHEIHSEIETWEKNFLDLVILFTKQEKNNKIIVKQRNMLIDIYSYANSKLKQVEIDATAHLHFTVPDKSTGLRQDQVVEIAKVIGKNENLLYEYQLLISACKAFRENSFRSTILESASAMEIALTNAVDQKISKIKISEKKMLVDRFRTLGHLIDLSRILGIDNCAEFDAKFALEERNKVVHKGYNPDRLAAKNFLLNAEVLIKQLSPKLSV
jgi:hypothetical protein